VSQETVELTRLAVERFNSRDVDGFLELNDPAIEFAPVELAVQGGRPYRGHQGVREWWKDAFEVFPDLSVEVVDVYVALVRNAVGGSRGRRKSLKVTKAQPTVKVSDLASRQFGRPRSTWGALA
jgi:hypothetical protein